jgi:hypothetical protein
MVNDEGITKIVVGAFIAGGGWIMKMLFSRTNQISYDMAKLKEELPKTYIAKEEANRAFDLLDKKFDKHIDSVSKNFSKLFDKLDGKQDKL